MAEYIGGVTELYKFIGQTLVYPKDAMRNDIQGVVYVSFIIDTDGSVTNAKIIKSIEKQLDDEALRIVNEMPKWKPGKFEGKLVKTEFALPVNFKLE
jgi:TonB family protein